ncbi:hypothetical protein L208DRAFT_1243897 [Tricholoma matsutake]|nr:hypothetical protein L208DRAFT_1243897 [Tricholoma matsutake 945]
MGGGSKNVPVINHTPRLTITVPPPNTNGKTLSESGDEQSDDDNDKHNQRTFCPLELHANIINMMERHFCAHPLIPGYLAPSPDGIKEWAVKQIYEFCFKHDLHKAWAYLWENWYHQGRWELWARCADTRIPRLKTTMMVEAHWRHIKKDFLHHFHNPQLDLLMWILMVKLAPTYY